MGPVGTHACSASTHSLAFVYPETQVRAVSRAAGGTLGWWPLLKEWEELPPGVSGQTPTSPPAASFCRYFINLCQKIYKGPQDCPDRASVCKKSASGEVQVLGLVHTQKLDAVGKARAPPCGRMCRV